MRKEIPIFQSTLLQEERPTITPDSAYLSNFNPRSYKRSDIYRIITPVYTFKFQSTLLQEERRRNILNLITVLEFQSTLLQEERPSAMQ